MVSTAAIIFLALFSTSTARPNLQRRGLPGAVYTCTAPDFRGECQWSAPSNRCFIQGPFPNGIMSIGPDPDGTCTLYEKFDCTGKEISTASFPGLAGGLPKFGAFKCRPNTQTRSAASVKALDPLADPRLAGGVGSVERKNHLKELEAMEKAGFKEGLIGLKKGVYY